LLSVEQGKPVVEEVVVVVLVAVPLHSAQPTADPLLVPALDRVQQCLLFAIPLQDLPEPER